MVIALDTNALYTSRAGVARYVRGLLTGLASNDAPGFRIEPFGWEVDNFEYRQPARSFRTFYRELVWGKVVAPRRMASIQADLYHATASYFVTPPVNTPTVVTLHDIAVLRHPERFRRWHRWSETRRMKRLHSVTRIICVSRFSADEAVQVLGLDPRRIEVVHNGCDFCNPSPPSEQKPDFEVPSEFFLFVGSLEPGKNLSLLSQVYQRAAASGTQLPPLLIVGARWEGVGTEDQPPAGWHYMGRQPDDVLVFLYRRALGLLFPSKYEGFGLPLVEAMALGCPVICGRVASLPEVGGDSVLYSDLSSDAYLLAARRLLSEPGLRDSLIQAGRLRAPLFKWQRCAEQTVEVYRQASKSG